MHGEYVADIVSGELDSTGVKIETVYCRIVPTYAVYRTSERVVVQYADDKDLGADQRLLLSSLNATRGEINGLIDGWRSSRDADENAMAVLFDRRVADALGVALQGQAQQGLNLLIALKADILEERTAAARRDYLMIASTTMMLIVAASLILYRLMEQRYGTAKGPDLALAYLFTFPAAIGSIGAFFSIAMGIRGRTILTDLQTNDNRADAILRIVIGSLSSIVLVCLLSGNFVTFGFGSGEFGSDGYKLERPVILIVIAFLAGFSERIVGDLLSRGSVTPLAATGGNTLAGGVIAPAIPTSAAGGANELNPLGRPGRSVQDRVASEPEATAAWEDVDGCCSGFTLVDEEITEDIDLPPASGGVATKAA